MRRTETLARVLAIALAPLCALQGCTAIAGLEEPEPMPPGGTTSGGGNGGGAGGGGAGGGGAGGGGAGGGGGCEPGSEITTLATGQISPRAIVVDDASVYWTTESAEGDNGVWKLANAGGQPVRLADTGVRHPIALAVDSMHVYWSDGADGSCGGEPDRDAVLRIPHGGPPNPTGFQILDSFCGRAQTIALDTTRVYWARPNSGRVPTILKSGNGNPDELIDPPGTMPFGIAVDDSHAYWTDQESKQVIRAEKNGAQNENLWSSSVSPRWIALDDESVYWTTDTLVLKHDKLPMDGAPKELHAGLVDIVALAVDRGGDAVYVIDGGAGKVVRVPKVPDILAKPIIDSADELGGVAVDEDFVYWTNTTTGEILRACK